MQDPNGINAQILPIWVPYIHVCWERVRRKSKLGIRQPAPLHYENKPIQIYWKLNRQNMKKKSDKNPDIFIFLLIT